MVSDATVATVALREEANVDPRLFALLVLHFGAPENVLEHPDRLTEVPQVAAADAEGIVAAGHKLDAVRVRLEQQAARGVRTICVFGNDYPESLRLIAEPPSCLYVRGSLSPSKRRVAVIGAADATATGIADAVAVGKELARLDVTPVSGLTGGVSGGVHLGCVTAGGTTCAVSGAGLDAIRTPEEEALAAHVVAAGALLSEYAPATRASRARAKAAARIKVGLSLALVLIEAELESADMMAIAEAALGDGKPVFVLSRELTDATGALFRLGAYPLPAPDGLDVALHLV